MGRHYPELNNNNIKLVKQLFEEDKTFFDDPDCPYSDEVKSIFRLSDIENDFDKNFDVDIMDSEEHIMKEINALYNHLQKFGANMRDSDTASEKNTYFKLSTTLLEKIISMKERVTNISKVNEFTETVLQILEEEVNVDDRTKVIERLRNVASN